MNKIEIYREEAIAWMDKNRVSSGLQGLTTEEYSHACALAASVMLTRDNIMHGGGFVQAIIENDLEQAVSRADNTARKALHAMVTIKKNCWPVC